MSNKIFWREVEVARQLALGAGNIVLGFYNKTDPKVSYKAGDEPVTEADQASSDYILKGLKEEFPDDILISEEEPDDPRRQIASRVWLIDPLDGTKEFILRNGEFSIMIGLLVDKKPVVGVVYQPTSDRLWWAADSEAFLCSDETQIPMKVSDVSDYSEMCMVVSRSHRNSIIDQMASRLGITKEITSGSGGIKLGIIANGESDVMFSPSPFSKIWDLCAPDAILKAAGGKVTDFQGNPLNYCGPELFNLNGVLASNGKRHDDILQSVKDLYIPPS